MINSFRGDNAFLSNFYILQNPIIYGWMVCPTSEHFFQAMKGQNRHQREFVLQAPSPKDSKLRGRTVDPVGWNNDIDGIVMHLALILKFTANEDLLTRLLATKDKVLLEGNYWHDNNWGNCACNKCANIAGLNRLGHLLMQVRDLFRYIGH